MVSVFCRQHIGRRVWLPWLRLITGGDLIQCAIKHRKCDYIPLMMVILFCGDNICFVALFINRCSLSVFGLCNTRWNNTVIIQMAASILLLYTASRGHNRHQPHAYTHTCLHLSIYARIYTHMLAYKRICTHIHTHACI